MEALRKLLSKLNSYEVVNINKTAGGGVLKSFTGHREQRFHAQLWRSYPRSTAGILVVVIATVLFGLLGYPQGFARMGALVVLAGVLFSVNCVRDIDGQLNIKIYATLLSYAQEIADGVVTMRAGTHPRVALGGVRAASEAQIQSEVGKLASAAAKKKSPFLRLELAFAIAGTLIWAFGDWLVCSVDTWSLSTCS